MTIDSDTNGGGLSQGSISRVVKTFGNVLLILISSGVSAFAAVYHSDGSAASVQALHNRASKGDTITLPPGTFTWSTAVKIWKAIKLQGAGSGRIIGNTKSSVAVGTGAKTFTTTRSGLAITAGQVLRIAKMPHPPGGGGSESNPPARGTYMEGTVSSYSGNTLIMNVTNTAGSGTWTFWWIATQPITTIINNYNNGAGNNNEATPLILVQQNQAGNTEIAGIHFETRPTSSSTMIGLRTNAYIAPKTLIHDCWFSVGNGSGSAAIFAATNQGLVWNCSLDDTFSQLALGLQFKWEDSIGQTSWSTTSTMGVEDTNGATNFYIEDCDFHAFLNATDFDSDSRVVFRHNSLDNSGMGSHGADTGPIGLRHVEIYDNELVFDDFRDSDGSVTLPLPWFFWMRGGTGVITDNILPAISSTAWGNKLNISFSVLNIRRNTGGYPCWRDYPAPHQVGQGYGPGAVHQSYYSGANYGRLDYYTYLEPVYIWGNSGTGANRVGLNAESDDPCSNNQQLTYYVQAGRDYKLEAKPGYRKYTYPHPRRSQSPPPSTANATPSSPQNVWKNKGKEIKKWKWGKAKENSTNGVTEGQKELGQRNR
jgi:hypothetical protein